MNNLYELLEIKGESEFLTLLSKKLQVYPHLHMQFEFIYILKGSIFITINSKRMEVNQGDMCIISNNQIHSFESYEYNEVFTLIFHRQFLPSFTNMFKNKKAKSPFLKSNNPVFMDNCCMNILKPDDIVNKISKKGYIYLLLGELLTHISF